MSHYTKLNKLWGVTALHPNSLKMVRTLMKAGRKLYHFHQVKVILELHEFARCIDMKVYNILDKIITMFTFFTFSNSTNVIQKTIHI